MVFRFLLGALCAAGLEFAVDLLERVSKDEDQVNKSKADNDPNVVQANLAASFRLSYIVAKQHEHVKDNHVGALVEGLHPGGKVGVKGPSPVDDND